MVMVDSIDPPDRLHTIRKSDSATNATFVHQAVFEQVEDDKEGRISGTTESHLYRNPIAEIDFSNRPYILVKLNPSNAASLFESISSDLPSPPPKV